MNPHNDRLDRAIDLAANRMVSVPEDDRMLDTIVARLPERSNVSWIAGFKWQLAGGAIALVAVAILSFNNRSTVVQRPFDPGVPIARVEPPSRATMPPDRAEPAVRTIVPNVRVERSARTSVANDAFDREFGLPPVGAPVEIAFKSIAVEGAIAVPASVVAPLVMSDLLVLDDSSSRD